MSAVRYPDPERWEPGLPLFTTAPFSRYLFNWRDDDSSRRVEDDCWCSDRATWPEPRTGFQLPEDPLGSFIREWKRWKEQEGEEDG